MFIMMIHDCGRWSYLLQNQAYRNPDKIVSLYRNFQWQVFIRKLKSEVPLYQYHVCVLFNFLLLVTFHKTHKIPMHVMCLPPWSINAHTCTLLKTQSFQFTWPKVLYNFSLKNTIFSWAHNLSSLQWNFWTEKDLLQRFINKLIIRFKS